MEWLLQWLKTYQARLIVLFILIAFLVMVALAGCSKLHIEGECVYSREVTVSYHCTPDGKLDQIRIHTPD